jgi:hypothetical protein
VVITIVVFSTNRDNFRANCFYRPGYYEKLAKESGFHVYEQFNYSPDDKKIISISLYGDHAKYFDGVDKLIVECREKLPDWKCRIYLHDKVSLKRREKLIDTGVQVFIVSDNMIKPGNSAGAFWRYMPATEPVTFVCLDVDEAIAEGMVYAIKTWYDQRDQYPYMRYNYGTTGAMSNFFWPYSHIVGGKWGKSEKFPIDPKTIMQANHRSTFGSDEAFLYFTVAPLAFDTGLLTFFTNTTFSRLSHVTLWPETKACADLSKEKIVIIPKEHMV